MPSLSSGGVAKDEQDEDLLTENIDVVVPAEEFLDSSEYDGISIKTIFIEEFESTE